MYFVGIDVNNLIILCGWMARQHCRKFIRLSSKKLLFREADFLAVGNTPETVFGYAGRHVPMFRIDDVVHVVPAKLVEVVVGLLS